MSSASPGTLPLAPARYAGRKWSPEMAYPRTPSADHVDRRANLKSSDVKNISLRSKNDEQK